MTPLEIGISAAASSGAESGGPFDFYAPIVFAPSTLGAAYQPTSGTVSPSATATTALPGGEAIGSSGSSGGTSPNPNSNTSAVPSGTTTSSSSSWLIYLGLAAAAALGIWLITKK